MESFIDKMNNYLDDYSFTENGAIAYNSSGKKLTDFNFKISYYRENPEKIEKDFIELLNSEESIETLAKFVFFIGDIREGLGERQTFRICLRKLLESVDNEKAYKLIELVPEYNRWDSVWKSVIGNNELFKMAISIINNQLVSDFYNQEENKPVSLIAKWLPSENASSKKTKELAKKIRKDLNLSSKKYRLFLSVLREYIQIVEGKMSSNRWNEIDYEKVPSKANLNYSDAFLRHDSERRNAYIENLKKGCAKINSSVVYPHEIVDKYRYNIYDKTYEQLWKALPKLNINNTLVVRDGSGSMTCSNHGVKPITVSTSLAIYLSENNSGQWKNKFVTFSSNPRIIDLSDCETLQDKLNKIYKFDECTNTNIYKTMELILNTAIKNNIKQEEMPETILIISDMQFDDYSFHMNGSLFEDIRTQFEACGYKLPKICFWNVDTDVCNTIPLQENEYGLILCSGFSINILKMFTSGNIDPYNVLMDVLNSDRYKPVGDVFIK